MIKMREARFWPKMKFKPIFFQVLWQFFNPKGSLLPLRQGYEGHGAAGPAQIPSGLCGVNSRGLVVGGIFTPHFERSEIVAGPPAEPSQFRSDIFKQTPPSFTFSEIERCCLGAKRLDMVFSHNFEGIFMLFLFC
jgi:hypothetical protein